MIGFKIEPAPEVDSKEIGIIDIFLRLELIAYCYFF